MYWRELSPGHLGIEPKAILKAGIERFDGVFLFHQNDKDGTSLIKVLDVFHRQAIKNSGFKFRLYTCRHMFATRALGIGIDLLTPASLPGYANLKMVCGTRIRPKSERPKRFARCKNIGKSDLNAQMKERSYIFRYSNFFQSQNKGYKGLK